MEVEFAVDIQGKVERLVEVLDFDHVNGARVICMRSHGSRADAYARIWNLPRIWQKALNVDAYYIIEVLSHHFDPLPEEEKEKVLIHELMHIPKTFSGALVPHTCFNKRIDDRAVNKVYREYKKRLKEREGDQ